MRAAEPALVAEAEVLARVAAGLERGARGTYAAARGVHHREAAVVVHHLHLGERARAVRRRGSALLLLILVVVK